MKTLDGMLWWPDYFTERRIFRLKRVTFEHTHGDPERFEEYFAQARFEMAEGIGGDLTVEQADDGEVWVTYGNLRGEYTVTADIWIDRRFRRYADQAQRSLTFSDLIPRSTRKPDEDAENSRRTDMFPGLTTKPETQSLCDAVEGFFRRIEACLRTLVGSPKQLQALFYSWRFADYIADDPFDGGDEHAIDKRWPVGRAVRDALPDECAATILSAYELNDQILHSWRRTSTPGARATAGSRARQAFENCMIGRHGPDWRLVALEG